MKILYFSLIIWILIDRFKPIWQDTKWSGYITNLVALVMGVAVAFTFDLDILVAMDLSEEVTILGKIFTAVALMGGSSCVHEILNIRTKTETEYEIISEAETKDFESEV